jgi:hypothetical protein
MATVHVFVSTGRFHSAAELRAFIDPTYTEDGDCLPSAFMREVGLSSYEPGCIEAIHGERTSHLPELLAATSYADQWVPRADRRRCAEAAICVFEPNRVGHPARSSLEYLGAFEYQVVFPEWLEGLVGEKQA